MSDDELDPVIHAPARLRIAITLATLDDGDNLSFTRLQELIGLTPGNLITHLRKLEDAGYVSTTRTARRHRADLGRADPQRAGRAGALHHRATATARLGGEAVIIAPAAGHLGPGGRPGPLRNGVGGWRHRRGPVAVAQALASPVTSQALGPVFALACLPALRLLPAPPRPPPSSSSPFSPPLPCLPPSSPSPPPSPPSLLPSPLPPSPPLPPPPSFLPLPSPPPLSPPPSLFSPARRRQRVRGRRPQAVTRPRPRAIRPPGSGRRRRGAVRPRHARTATLLPPPGGPDRQRSRRQGALITAPDRLRKNGGGLPGFAGADRPPWWRPARIRPRASARARIRKNIVGCQ